MTPKPRPKGLKHSKTLCFFIDNKKLRANIELKVGETPTRSIYGI